MSKGVSLLRVSRGWQGECSRYHIRLSFHQVIQIPLDHPLATTFSYSQPQIMVLFTKSLVAALCLNASVRAMHRHQARGPHPVGAPAFGNVVAADHPLRILISNDDSWASANTRALYYALQTAGHKPLVVAPSHQGSGSGGNMLLPTSTVLESEGRFGAVPAGAHYRGRNQSDHGLHYINTTPSMALLYGLDVVAPDYFQGQKVDLVVGGINEGSRPGPFNFHASSTIAVSYRGVERNYPAIAFMGPRKSRSYLAVDYNDAADPSVRLATEAANLVSELARRGAHARGGSSSQNEQQSLMPMGVGVVATFGSGVDSASECPRGAHWVRTRMTGGAFAYRVDINPATDLLLSKRIYDEPAINVCRNADCTLPGETSVIARDPCAAAFTPYSIELDAPVNAVQPSEPHFQAVLHALNSRRAVIDAGTAV